MLNATEHDILARARQELVSAKRGDRATIVQRAATALGCAVPTVYRKLETAGFASGRKRRSDARASVLSEAELNLVAGVLRASLNNKGQRMPVRTALDMLLASRQLATDVHESTAGRQLYQRGLHPEQMALPTPSVQLRSLHPNHVWQIDSTTGAYYYLPKGRLRWMPEDQFYKNKVANLVKASTDLLTRYAATDHASGSFKCRYYLGGETAENLLDFATWAMWRQDSNPMQGVPFVLMLDQGAANRSHLMRNFCRRVGIGEPLFHAPGAARVTGAVEKTHDIVRMHFETRFRFIKPEDVTLDRLNADIEQWFASHCATRIHTRHGKTRYGAWMAILPEQLRAAASLEALREAAVSESETRRVSNLKRITFGRPSLEYSLALVPGVVAGLTVTVQSNPFRAPAIDVRHVDVDTGEEVWHVVEPLQTNALGFDPQAPVIGQDMRRATYSQVDHARSQLTRQAYQVGDQLPTLQEAEKARKAHAAAYADLVDPMADVKATQVPIYLPRRSQQLELPQREVAARRLSVVQACMRLKDMLGEAYSPQVYAHVQAQYSSPEDPGVPEDQLEGIKALFTPEARDDGTGGLRAVGGGEA
jgi:hypothetical protein